VPNIRENLVLHLSKYSIYFFLTTENMEVYEEINSYLVTCKLYVAHTSKFEFIAQKKQQLKLNLEHFCV
jgi:hypothetical protein